MHVEIRERYAENFGESFVASCYYLITLMFAVMAGKYDDDYYDCAVLLCAAFESRKEVNERHEMTLQRCRQVLSSA